MLRPKRRIQFVFLFKNPVNTFGHRVLVTVHLFRHADCIVIPSISESIPLVLSEGVNANKPLIVTNVGDMGYLAEKYKLGYVVEKENYNDLAEALIKMSNAKIRASFYDKHIPDVHLFP